MIASMTRKKSVRDLDVAGRRVLLRVDFNVPLERASGAVADDTRLRASLPTLRWLLERGAAVVVCSHLGRPDGKVVESLRLRPVASRLAELLDSPVQQAEDCVGPAAEAAARSLKAGEVLLLENLRFHPEEEANDPAFARALAGLADLYVNDAFGTAHRAHASTAGVAAYLPAAAGLLMERELQFLGGALQSPARPFAALVGGAKVSGKIAVLEHLLPRLDLLLIGGGMACTFLAAEGHDMGDSLVEEGYIPVARRLREQAAGRGIMLGIPEDGVLADRFAADATARVAPADGVGRGWRMLDIGPATARRYCGLLRPCQTVLWNGPMGVFEWPAFAEGTQAMASCLCDLDATTIVGGGETVQAIEGLGLAERFTHLSTGGGASLELLEGRTLPGVAALSEG